MSMPEREHWKVLCETRKQKQFDSIPQDWITQISSIPEQVQNVTRFPDSCPLLSPLELEITNTVDVGELLTRLSRAEWTAVQVTRAFYKRAIIAQQLTNCLTEIFVDRAIARAARLDEHLQKTGKVVGPLHGLPISVKDQLCIQGLETIMGYAAWIGRIASHNAVLVDILEEAGAVVFTRTNVPQTLQWAETMNNVFGRTVNPYNRSLTCGGSSGGEGALVALRGSPLGVGSDIGGSIRIPASMCGTYGLRPSYHRFPYQGALNSAEGQDTIHSVLGPLANTLSGIKTFAKVVIDSKPWLRDPMAVRKKWDEDSYLLEEHGRGVGLCFGFLWNDGVTVPHPPVIRAMEITKKALTDAGHRVIDWVPYKHAEIYNLLGQIWEAGGREDFLRICRLSGEPLLTSMAPDIPAAEEFRPPGQQLTALQLWDLHTDKRLLRKEYLDHWQATKDRSGTGRPVDALISPVAPFAAPPHGLYKTADYTEVFNLLDYPALAFPVTFVSKDLDKPKPPHNFLNDGDRENYELYRPETFEDAPVGLQLVGHPLEEEAVIGMGEIVVKALEVKAKST